jgi:hypothetical protein
MNAEFNIAPETIDELLTKEILVTKGEMILKIKKPDYLGESQWEFRHGNRKIMASIIDKDWLINFHSRRIDVRPGDSLRCDMRIDANYGFDGEVVAEHYIIMVVKEVITGAPPEQGSLFSQ